MSSSSHMCLAGVTLGAQRAVKPGGNLCSTVNDTAYINLLQGSIFSPSLPHSVFFLAFSFFSSRSLFIFYE